MARILEKQVKAAVKKVLANSKQYGYIYSNWPVPAGYGTSTLDCFGCISGEFFAIETKAPGKKPTPRQEVVISEMREAAGRVFVIDTPSGTAELEGWLNEVCSGHTR